MLRDRVSQSLLEAVRRLAGRGAVPETGWPQPEVEAPKQADHGDLATNWALAAAKAAGTNPRALAEALVAELAGDPLVARAEVAGPGFVNLSLSEAALVEARAEAAAPSEGLLADPAHFGRPPAPAEPHGFNVEFVSVNPNGPITIGSGRGAAYGSTLCNVLEASGHGVHREYYINDGVNSEQMRLFAESVKALVEGKDLPDQGYRGDYVEQLAKRVLRTRFKLPMAFSLPILLVATKLFVDMRDEGIRPYSLVDDFVVDDLIQVWLSFGSGNAELRQFEPLREQFIRARGAIEYLKTVDLYDTERGFLVLPFIALSMSFALDRWPEMTENPDGQWASAWAAVDIWLSETCKDFLLDQELQRLADVPLGGVQELETVQQGSKQASERLRAFVGEGIREKSVDWYQLTAQELMIDAQRRDLEAFGVTFDTWFSEQSLHDGGVVAEWIDHLVESGVADERPQRTKVKFAKGGVMEEVTVEPQTGDEEDDSAATDGQPTLWLRSTLFGDDMDRVLRRRDGRLTYIASDVAYHADKFNRGSKPPLPQGGEGAGGEGVRTADRLITVLGPDHHGYIGRLHAVVAADLMAQGTVTPSANQVAPALSEAEAALYGSIEQRDACQAALAASRERLTVQIFQLVRFLKDGKPAPMRKRDGNIYALIDLVREIGQKVRPEAPEAEQLAAGKDVARFFYLMRHHDTTFDFDLDLAEKQSDENPVFYVQYAHARICGVLRTAAEAGVGPSTEAPGPLHPKERALLLKVADLPNEVRRCAEDFGVNRLATYAIELARAYHHFYDACRVVDSADPATSASRVQTCLAAQSALRGALELLGVSAPERM